MTTTSFAVKGKGRAIQSQSPNRKTRGQSLKPVGHGRAVTQAVRAGGPIKPFGHTPQDTQQSIAEGPINPGDQKRTGNLSQGVSGPIESGGDTHIHQDNHSGLGITTVIDELREQWKRRQMWHRAEKSLTLQAKAMCRRLLGGDKKEAEVLYKSSLNGGKHELATAAFAAMFPLLQGRDGIEKARLEVEKRLLKLAKQLPVAPWIEGVRGVGMLSLAGMIGEAGDLGSYSNPAKLWKRMGLAVIGGERQRKKEGAAGIEHGYNPARRSLMWTIGDCIIRAGGPLKELYNERKAYESPRVKTKMHAHNRAKRYIEKRLLRDLWRAWRDSTVALAPILQAHPSDSISQ